MTILPGDQRGQYFVARTSGLAGWLIRFGTRSEWNHAGVIVGLDGTTVEARPPRSGYGNVHRYKHTLTSDLPLTQAQRDEVCHQAARTAGRKYGWVDIAADTLLALGIRWQWAIDRAASSATADCSADVARIYRDAGVPLPLHKAPAVTTPGDLADLILGRPVPQDW